MGVQRNIYIDLRITVDEYKKLYAGVAQNVNALARDGRRIQFPAALLRRYVTADGISGSFELCVDEHNKLIHIRRIDV